MKVVTDILYNKLSRESQIRVRKAYDYLYLKGINPTDEQLSKLLDSKFLDEEEMKALKSLLCFPFPLPPLSPLPPDANREWQFFQNIYGRVKQMNISYKTTITIFVVIVVAIILLFGWPTLYRYDKFRGYPIRTNRLTDKVEVWAPGRGWVKESVNAQIDEEINEEKSKRRVAEEEVRKLKAEKEAEKLAVDEEVKRFIERYNREHGTFYHYDPLNEKLYDKSKR